MREIIDHAVRDAVTLEEAGFEAVIVENVSDGPFGSRSMSNQQLAALAVVTKCVRDRINIEVGIDACGNSIAGIEIASVIDNVSFVRIPWYVDVRIGMNGIVEPNGGDAAWVRKQVGADAVKILADIQIKHTYPLQDAIPIEQSAKWAIDSKADCIIVTGITTGAETPIESIRRVKTVSTIPVIAGSGVSGKNYAEQYAACDGSIIGSSLKKDGNLMNPVDPELAKQFISNVRSIWKENGK